MWSRQITVSSMRDIYIYCIVHHARDLKLRRVRLRFLRKGMGKCTCMQQLICAVERQNSICVNLILLSGSGNALCPISGSGNSKLRSSHTVHWAGPIAVGICRLPYCCSRMYCCSRKIVRYSSLDSRVERRLRHYRTVQYFDLFAPMDILMLVGFSQFLKKLCW